MHQACPKCFPSRYLYYLHFREKLSNLPNMYTLSYITFTKSLIGIINSTV